MNQIKIEALNKQWERVFKEEEKKVNQQMQMNIQRDDKKNKKDALNCTYHCEKIDPSNYKSASPCLWTHAFLLSLSLFQELHTHKTHTGGVEKRVTISWNEKLRRNILKFVIVVAEWKQEKDGGQQRKDNTTGNSIFG